VFQLLKHRVLYHPKEVQDDEDDSNNDQDVNPTANLRKVWADPAAEKAEQPQDNQDYDNGPQHDISPFECSSGCHLVA
jgi:hypothetical protein